MKTGLFFISMVVVAFITWLGDRVIPEPAMEALPAPVSLADVAPAAVPIEESAAETPVKGPHFAGEPAYAKLSPGAILYLQSTFCNDNLCGDEGWSRWVIADAESVWKVQELVMIRHVLENSLGALDSVGIDGQELLDGYRFRRFTGEYVDNKPGRVAMVVHSKMEITVSDTAFVRQQGFYIYHEIGHAVDTRLGRNLNNRFHRLATDDYKLRRQAQHRPEEATADAFAVWVMVGYTGARQPVFKNTPATADYVGISQAVEQSLHGARAIRPD